jgi:type VI secretion system secreted protein VgrG
MSGYSQVGRAMAVTTPLGKDALLLAGFAGREGISQLFSFQLQLLATNDTPISFEKLLGQKISVAMSLPSGVERYFNGIARQVGEGKRDQTFTHYRIEMVPKFWLWTKKVQSRVFQHLSVPDILTQVLTGLDVAFELNGTFHPRDYCVQYRESDFDFASRLMEEEGIYYYFAHDAGGHKMIVANAAQSHRSVPAQPQAVYDVTAGGSRDDMRVTSWEKIQEVCSGKVTLWDHCFELPDNHLQAEKTIQESVAAGKVEHKFKVADNSKLEVYEYPGGYAQRFDGMDRGGGDDAGNLKNIFKDNARTAEIRMQQEALSGLVVRGGSNCRQFASGHKFALQRHFNADGEYVLTNLEHQAKLSGDFRSGQTTEFAYENGFTCVPLGLPFRPALITRKPAIQGSQTAVVTGPPGEEIFCDKYGRVKVQFFWDRQGKRDGDTSCWIRVGQVAAGQGFGALNLPRIGQEVIVSFLEGDPDQPIIVGVVYNSALMPPYDLPKQRTYSGVIHRSHHGVAKNASEICFQNRLGSELLRVHAETDSMHQAENNHLQQVGKVHRHEVGQFYSTIIGKPVNVNQVAVGPPSGAGGSGAGGGPPRENPVEDGSPAATPESPTTGSGSGGGNPPTPADAQDQFPDLKGAQVQIYGDNTTETYGDNHTTITGDDHYTCKSSQFSSVDNAVLSKVAGAVVSYESNLLDVVFAAKLEFSGMMHVDFALLKVNDEGVATNVSAIKMFTLG